VAVAEALAGHVLQSSLHQIAKRYQHNLLQATGVQYLATVSRTNLMRSTGNQMQVDNALAYLQPRQQPRNHRGFAARILRLGGRLGAAVAVRIAEQARADV